MTTEKIDSMLARLTERELITALLQYSDDTIITKSLDGTILSWNAGAERMYGYTADEVIGKPVAILVPAGQPNEVPAILARLKRGEKIDHYETMRVTKDGRLLHVSLSVTPIKDDQGNIIAALKIARDITPQKRAQRSAEHLQQITNALASVVSLKHVADVMERHDFAPAHAHLGAIVMLDPDGSLTLLAQYGPKVDAEASVVSILSNPNSIFNLPAATGEALWFGNYRQWLSEHPDDPALWTQAECRALSVLPLVVDERIIGVMCFGFIDPELFDTFERDYIQTLAQQCAQALWRAQLYEAERQARELAQKADELKLKFLAMISHELRTPLASIKGFTSTLLSTDVKWDVQSQYGFIQIVDQEADKLTRLIDELLDLSQLQAGRLKISIQLERLVPIVDNARVELEALSRDHRLTINVPSDLPPVRIDGRRVAQVISNLVSNASKYSPADTWIRVSAVRDGDNLRVDVTDEGMGIEPELREKIFEAFQQGNDLLKGAGLGLAICRGLVEAQGGRIWVQDRPGPGTTVSFTLPVAE